jgi:hypothetical protein
MHTTIKQSELTAEARGIRTASDKAVVCKELLGAWWEIPHPGTLEKLRCDTLKEAMDKWFEGFNIPVLVVDGVRESFDAACFRVSKYVNAPNDKLTHHGHEG